MNWQQAKITQVGLEYLGYITAKGGEAVKNFKPTRVAFGRGNLTNVEGATRLVSEIGNAEIISINHANNTTTFTVRISNASFTKEEYIREMGIYVNFPGKGEVLFSAMTDSDPDKVPAPTGSSIVMKTIIFGIGYANTDNVTISLSSTAWVSPEEAQRIAQEEIRQESAKKYQLVDSTAATNSQNTIPNLLNMIASQIKNTTGKDSWVKIPGTNLDTVFKNATVANDTITLTRGDGTSLQIKINNVDKAQTASTQNTSDSSKSIANTEFVQNVIAEKAILKGQTRASYGDNGFRVFSDGFAIMWGVIKFVGTMATATLPITGNIYYAAAFDLVGKEETQATTTTNIQLSIKNRETIQFVASENLQTVEYLALVKI